jgi:Protein of unknown function (DUF4230)
MFKLILKLFLLFSLIAVLIVVGISSGVISISKIEPKGNSENKPILSEIESIGNLQLIKFNINYTVQDTTNNDTLVNYKLPSGGKILALITGEVDACINFKGIVEEDIKEGEDTIYVSLPMPVLCDTKIDYENSKVYDTNFDYLLLKKEAIDRIFPNVRNNIKAEAIRMGILDQAKVNAKKFLLSLLKQVSKKNFVLDFREI